MKKYYVEVWASVFSGSVREIVEIELEHEPTEKDMEEVYQEVIGNIMESGYFLSNKAEYEKYCKEG